LEDMLGDSGEKVDILEETVLFIIKKSYK